VKDACFREGDSRRNGIEVKPQRAQRTQRGRIEDWKFEISEKTHRGGGGNFRLEI
jgi:hypothetical protein